MQAERDRRFQPEREPRPAAGGGVSEAGGRSSSRAIYTFKIFGRRSDTFVERVREIIAATLGAVPPDAVRCARAARAAT